MWNNLNTIYSDLCIRLTGSCGQQQRLRGWFRMVVKQFQDGERPPFWKSIYRHISVKNHRVFMKFVHSSRFWTGWTSRVKKKWKSCIEWTPSSREHNFLFCSDLLKCKDDRNKSVAMYTTSSAIAERPRDASCLSVVSFNSTSTLPPARSFIIGYFDFIFTTAYN